jgi:hypothetical protein
VKRTIAYFICSLLGAMSGYVAAPVAAAMYVQSVDAPMFAETMLYGYKEGVLCDCTDQSVSQSAKELSGYLSSVQALLAKNPKSRMLAQESGLTYIRLSIVEGKLGHQSQADEDANRGQSELAALGWKNVSRVHLTSLVAQLDSEYEIGKPKEQFASTSHSTHPSSEGRVPAGGSSPVKSR